MQLAGERIVLDSEPEVLESVDFLRKPFKNAEEIEDLRAEPYLWRHFQWLRAQRFARVELATVGETVSKPRGGHTPRAQFGGTSLKLAHYRLTRQRRTGA